MDEDVSPVSKEAPLVGETSVPRETDTTDPTSWLRHSVLNEPQPEFFNALDLDSTRQALLRLTDQIDTRAHGAPRKDLTALAIELESVSRALNSAQVALTSAMEREHVAAAPLGDSFGFSAEPDRPQYRGILDFLVDTLRITRREARERLRVARGTAPGSAMSGEPTPARYPVLARALKNGEVSTSTAAMILKTVGDIRSHAGPLDPEQDGQPTPAEWAELAETTLCDQSTRFNPDTLNKIAKHFTILANQDGCEPSDRYLARHQGITYLGYEHGLHTFRMRMTDEQYEKFVTRMASILNPPRDRSRSAKEPAETAAEQAVAELKGQLAARTSETDILKASTGQTSTYQQRLLEALLGLCARGELVFPESGSRATVVALIDEAKLFPSHSPAPPAPPEPEITPRQRITFQHSGAASTGTLRQLACEAEIIPVVLGGDSVPLDVGRSRRLFSKAQRIALAARDGGCIFEGCTMPLALCEAHHVSYWDRDHGPTDVNNGALLCPYHHHFIHQGTWKLSVLDDKPWVIPPAWIDPQQTPQRNAHFQPPTC